MPDPHDLEDLDELPPLDGDVRDPAEPEPDYTDLLDETDEAGGLDDATAEDEPADADEIDLDESEGGWLGEASDAPDLDLGDMALLDFGEDDSTLDDSESPAGTDEDVLLGDLPERGGLDAGEEGPLDADEELREADLPALDADEEGDVDDASLVDPGFVADEPRGLAWAALPWTRVGAPLPFAVATAVVCSDRGALVLGRLEGGTAGLVRVDLEGTCEVLAAEGLKPAGVTALAVEGSIVAAVQTGKVWVSRDGGAHFGPAPAPTAEGISAGQVALLAGRLWVGTRGGGLLVEDLEAAAGASGPPVERCALPGTAAALTCAPEGVGRAPQGMAVLVVDDRGRPTALVRVAAGGSIEREVIDAPEASGSALLAVRGEHAAYAAVGGGS